MSTSKPPVTKAASASSDTHPGAKPPPTQQQVPQPSSAPQFAFSDEERMREAQKAAEASLEAQRKSYKLTQAVLGAGDPEVRQRLLQEALNHEVEAESFGKAAKWIQSGAFQGFVYGCIPGATLGALTGTLVGGVVSLVTGGLGAGIGALAGPRFKLGDLAGKLIRKITPDFPGWNATEEQEQALKEMVLDVHSQDMPSRADLEAIAAQHGVSREGVHGQSWAGYAKSYVPTFGLGGARAGHGDGEVKVSEEELQRAERHKAKDADALRTKVEQSDKDQTRSNASNSSAAAGGGNKEPANTHTSATNQSPKPSLAHSKQAIGGPQSSSSMTSTTNGKQNIRKRNAGASKTSTQPVKDNQQAQPHSDKPVKHPPRKLERRSRA